MNDIAMMKESGLPTQFDPGNAYNRQAQADAIIALARRTKDWPLLEQAADMKIADQQDFVRWWDANVGKPGGEGGGVVARSATTISADEAERLTGFDKKQVSRMRKNTSEPNVDGYKAKMLRGSWKVVDPSVAEANHRAVGTGENEWYTPPEYIEAARAVMGSIDLDPATSEIAQSKIRANKYLTASDDGLAHDWFGNVWLNPPYSQPAIMHFLQKLTGEYSAGNIEQAVCLTHNYTDTAWFQLAASVCEAVCFTRGRIGFLSPSGEKAAPTQGQAFFYYGPNRQRFAEVFSSFGFVVVRPHEF